MMGMACLEESCICDSATITVSDRALALWES